MAPIIASRPLASSMLALLRPDVLRQRVRDGLAADQLADGVPDERVPADRAAAQVVRLLELAVGLDHARDEGELPQARAWGRA